MVVAAGDHELWVRLADPCPHVHGLPEIQGSPLHRRELTGRDSHRISGRVLVRVELHQVAHNTAAALTGQVEIGVVGEVHDGGGVRRRAVVDAELAVAGERVTDHRLKRPRIALLAVRAGIGQLHGRIGVASIAHDASRPHLVAEARRPSMQVKRRAIPGELIRRTVQGERSARDAVGVTAGDGAEVGVAFQVIREVVEAQHDVRRPPGTVRRLDRLQNPTVGEDPDPQARRTAQRVGVHLRPIGRGPEDLCGHGWRFLLEHPLSSSTGGVAGL